jgi:hypothetical protein
MSRKIIRIGNEFWIEGDWTSAVTIYADSNLHIPGDPLLELKVGWGSRGVMNLQDATDHSRAIQAAIEYVQEYITKGPHLTYAALKDLWRQEYIDKCDILDEWEEKRKQERLERRKQSR